MNTLSILLFMVAVASIAIACAVIFSRRRKAQSAADKALRKAAEEEQRNEAEQKAMRRAEEEERQRVEAERRRLEEEVQRAEEECRRSEEEGKRLEGQEYRKAWEVQPEAEERQRLVEPWKRGGRSRAATEAEEKQPAQEIKSRHPKPEIVCWKRERQWIPTVEVSEELIESPNLAVLQNGLPLTQDESREGCWRLRRLFGQVVVRWNEDEVAREIKIALGEESYLLFKLSVQNQNQGRRVKFPSSGSYLVVVPENWERDEALSGPPRVVPEPVSVAGYKAHFFDLEKDGIGKIAFRTPTGESIVIKAKASRFELVGSRLHDAREDRPLFGERPPQIRALDDRVWENIGTIVVGEEGAGKGRWRMDFSPVQDPVDQDLPSEVAARKSGWYFLRFYDTSDDLIDSLDFRFISALKEISIFQPSPLPSANGHKEVRVEFLHEPGCAVQPADSPTNIQIERQDDKTILAIPSDPVCDETRWLVGPGGGPQVEVTILVERLWWTVGDEDNAPSEWEDQLLALAHDDLAATSGKALWLRLPKRRWTDEVLVGFERSRADRCPIQVTRRDLAKPLRDFVTVKEITDREHEHLLKVWIELNDGLVERVIAIVPAEQPTRVEKELPRAEAQNEPVEEKLLLNLEMVPAPRLATVLTLLRRETVGALRVLIKEVRKKYFKRRLAESMEYKSYALCMIALALELNPQIPGLKNRWAVRAKLARYEFPEIMNRVRNHYKEISNSCAYRAGSMRDRRETV